MTRDYLSEIVAAKSLAQAQYIFTQLENALSPLELAEIAPRLHTLPAGVRVLVAASLALRHIENARPQTYRSSDLCEGARLFADPAVPVARKSLLLAFAGTSQRVMLPMSLFAQLLPADRFDILLIADRNNMSFSNGIEGLAAPFVDFVRQLGERAGVSNYASCYTFGTSMGALPALRAARLLGARRAIGIGAVFPWQIKLMLSVERPKVGSFDMLCGCGPGQDVPTVVAFSGGYERDRHDAERLALMSGAELMAFDRYTTHNLVNLLYRDGELPAFLGKLMDFDPQVSEASHVPTWVRIAWRSRRLLRKGWARVRGKPVRRAFDPLDRDQPNP